MQDTLAHQKVLDFYTQSGAMTQAGQYAAQFEALPRDIETLVAIVQGLLLHQHIAPHYGVTLSAERIGESHIRPVPEMLDQLLTHDTSPICTVRSLDNRLVGTCRDFSLLLVAFLRAQQIPARARCGFATYFVDDFYVDHWVCEYWKADESRWGRVDAQLDDVQKGIFKPDFDVLDVPPDRFLIAGDAWARCRSGELDPDKFGIMDMHGLWFIGGDVVRDFAALNNQEMLPWDAWEPMPLPNEPAPAGQMELLDHLAILTQQPDEHFQELRVFYEESLQVPGTVFNSVLNRAETV